MTFWSLSFAPYVPNIAFLALCAVSTAVVIYVLWRRRPGAGFRALAIFSLVFAISNPSWIQQERNPQSDIALIVVDDTASQSIDGRQEQTDTALQAVTQQLDAINGRLSREDSVSYRIVRVPDGTGLDIDAGSRVLSALAAAASETSPDRLAGAIIISDGRIDDVDSLTEFAAPIHHLLTGNDKEWDRRLLVETAPAFGIVGEDVELTLRIEHNGSSATAQPNQVPVNISIDGAAPVAVAATVGATMRVPLKLLHGGNNVLELTVPEEAGELTKLNNQAIITINGIRDRLRVLLVSGEPYAGERTWRNLLKADPAVDLVHFTILRPPTKQDGVPVFELSLIAFPTRELFMDKIEDFDLIIFDRYRNRDVLPDLYLDNVVNYVRNGGALLVASGPTFAGADSLFRTPIGQILPAKPTGQVFQEGYVPMVSDLGLRHPVTEGLAEFAPRPASADGVPGWGRWFRLVDVTPLRGQVVMAGLDQRPLLVLDRVGEGRIAQLGSDQAWLWSRGYEGGGPQLELLRRLAHWLMKEPELEEETLIAEAGGAEITVVRKSLENIDPATEVTSPDGSVQNLALTEIEPGTWQGKLAAGANGIYKIANGDLSAVAAIGPAAPREFINPISTPDMLAPLVALTEGGTFRLADGIPEVRLVREGRVAVGRGWLGLTRRGAFLVADIKLTPLAPPWLFLGLAALSAIAAWRREAR